MIRLKNIKYVIYDTNILVYQCFPDGRYRIIALTKTSKNLTRFLFNQDSSIVVPNFIISELEEKGFLEIIDEYFAPVNIHNIYNHPKKVDEAFKLRLFKKLRVNYNQLKQHDNFLIEEYVPSKDLMKKINSAFVDFNNLDNADEYLNRKDVGHVNPSEVDKMLLLFSKEKEYPLISNDLDITFFAEELLKRDLMTEIIEFSSISSINN